MMVANGRLDILVKLCLAVDSSMDHIHMNSHPQESASSLVLESSKTSIFLGQFTMYQMCLCFLLFSNLLERNKDKSVRKPMNIYKERTKSAERTW